MKHKTRPQTVIAVFIAGTEPRLTRNPLRDRVSSSCTGDGGSLSAMTVKGVMQSFFVIVCLLMSSCTKKQDKVEVLLSQMTLEEKCGQLTCPIGFNFYGKDGDSLWLADDFIGMMDTLPLGSCWAVLRADPWSRKTVETGLKPRESARLLNMMQHHAVENTRLGIPLLFCEETPWKTHGSAFHCCFVKKLRMDTWRWAQLFFQRVSAKPALGIPNYLNRWAR